MPGIPFRTATGSACGTFVTSLCGSMDEQSDGKSKDLEQQPDHSSSAPTFYAPTTSRSCSVTETATSEDVAALLDEALEIPRKHPWVSDFLFQSDDADLPLPSAVCGIQKASAALLDFSVRECLADGLSGKPQSTSQQQELSSPNFLADSGSLCLIPILSRESITLCMLIRKASDGEISSADDLTKVRRRQGSVSDVEQDQASIISCSKCAFDNGNTILLSVESHAADEGPYEVMYLSNDPRKGRAVSMFQFQGSSFRKRILGSSEPSSQLVGEVSACSSYSELRNRCANCGQTFSDQSSESCTCSYLNENPTHPLDFAMFARNIVPYAGCFPAEARIWLRAPMGKLHIVAPPFQVVGEISVSVNHESVAELCRLAVLNVERQERERVDDVARSSCLDRSVGTSSDLALRDDMLAGLSGSTSRDDDIWNRASHIELQQAYRAGSEGKSSSLGLLSTWSSVDPFSLTNSAFASTSVDAGSEATQAGLHCGSHTGVSTESLRRIRNREAAARSNMRRKEKLELLKLSLREVKLRVQTLTEDERRLRLENEELRIEASRGGRGSHARGQAEKDR